MCFSISNWIGALFLRGRVAEAGFLLGLEKMEKPRLLEAIKWSQLLLKSLTKLP